MKRLPDAGRRLPSPSYRWQWARGAAAKYHVTLSEGVHKPTGRLPSDASILVLDKMCIKLYGRSACPAILTKTSRRRRPLGITQSVGGWSRTAQLGPLIGCLPPNLTLTRPITPCPDFAICGAARPTTFPNPESLPKPDAIASSPSLGSSTTTTTTSPPLPPSSSL